MSESRASELLAFDLTDRLHKALRVGQCKPGEMRKILGVSESTMTNYLTGKTRPKDGMLRQWAMRCGGPVTFDWLAYGIEPETGPEGGDYGLPDGRRAKVLRFGARQEEPVVEGIRAA